MYSGNVLGIVTELPELWRNEWYQTLNWSRKNRNKKANGPLFTEEKKPVKISKVGRNHAKMDGTRRSP